MDEKFYIKPIAHIYNGFSSKFGVPRQSGIVDSVESVIIFEPEYRNPDALREIECFSHIWLIWQFSLSVRENWSPTVRPPRLGGNRRIGVFATRSPFRPNHLGLSSVKLDRVETDKVNGPVLYVTGADIVNGTPIFDIKPYIPFSDCHTDANGGYADENKDYSLKVEIPSELLNFIPTDKREAVIGILAHDPRPAYQDSPDRIYGVPYAGLNIKFMVDGNTLTVISVE